jgi:hypothetical protein
MFIDREAKTLRLRFGGAEWFWSGEALLESRSSERSWSGVLTAAYKHFSPNGVKTSGQPGLG